MCIRPDNMGDLLMSSPAMRALKESIGCSLTLLTSSMAAALVPFLPFIDEVIPWNVPWVKTGETNQTDDFFHLVEHLKQKQFDAAVIFTVFSQNPLPAALLIWLAGIPNRLAYCRENPYHLLTHWVPDKEPYRLVQHQVQRDLNLVKTIGAVAQDKRMHLKAAPNSWPALSAKLASFGVNLQRHWLLVHAGVSEKKREYPKHLWEETGKKIIQQLGYQVILTGNKKERANIADLQQKIGAQAFNTAGLLPLEEFITLVKKAPLVVSVNTVTIHIAAAVQTPVVVLYALSNPQHTPWMATGKLLWYDVPEGDRSPNEVLQFVYQHLHPQNQPMVMPSAIVQAVREVLDRAADCLIPELIPFQTPEKVF